MMISVEFHHQSRRMAIEVDDKPSENVLPAKVLTQEFVGSQLMPEDSLLRSRILTQLLRQQPFLAVSFSIDESHVIR